ncbi:MAG: flagellar motor switch protein FliG [Thermoleophilia bacterium]
MATTTDSRLSGRRKAAILCVSLGTGAASEILKRLPEDVMEVLTVEMARTPTVEPDDATEVLEEATNTALAHGYIAEGGLRYAREVLERAVGGQRAAEILNRLASVIEAKPFEFLRGTPPDWIFTFLRNEHPQTIALVVAHMPTMEMAAKVVQQMPPELQAEVALRIAQMDQVSPDVVKEVAAVMETKLDSIVQHEYSSAGGVKALAEILNSADRGTERNVLEHLESANEAIADEVRSLLFVFEDIVKLDDRAIQLILKEVDAKDLALALRGASAEVQDRILSNMSSRGAEMLREEMQFMPPQRRRVVEEAQTKIVAIVRRLEDAGAIILSRGGDSEDELIG